MADKSKGRFWRGVSFAFVRNVLWLFRSPIFIVLLGGPGAGKGTLAKILARLLGIPHVSTGDLFRREIESGSALGKVVEPILKSGGLVPDEITIAVLAEELSKYQYRFGAIIDGFPRTFAQALLLDDLFTGWGQKVNFTFFLDGKKEDLEVRLSGRRTCSNKKCGATYHVEFTKPVQDGICDDCKSPLYRREDDAPEVVGPRIEKFNANNAPIVVHYDGARVLYTITTTNRDPKGHVEARVMEILRKHGVKAKRST